MKRSITRRALLVVPVLLLAVGGAHAAGAPLPFVDDDEAPITGEDRDRAVDAALASVGAGSTAIETEVGDEESLYEVEVRAADGSTVDVQLDEQFDVVSSSTDDDQEDDDGKEG